MKEEFKLKDIYDKYRENKNSHVYLVETNSVENALSDIKKFIIRVNDDSIKPLVESESLPTMFILKPQKQEILSQDVAVLVNSLQKIPVITKENYYIVCEAEKLNTKSGNSMLKIIEEPVTDSIGFFVCNSADEVLSTIQSRAQYVKINYDVIKEYDNELLDDVHEYIEKILNKDSLLINKKIVDKYKDINNMLLFVECMISELEKRIKSSKSFDIIKHESLIIKKLYELESKIKNNGNINLILDKFVIEVGRL